MHSFKDVVWCDCFSDFRTSFEWPFKKCRRWEKKTASSSVQAHICFSFSFLIWKICIFSMIRLKGRKEKNKRTIIQFYVLRTSVEGSKCYRKSTGHVIRPTVIAHWAQVPKLQSKEFKRSQISLNHLSVWVWLHWDHFFPPFRFPLPATVAEYFRLVGSLFQNSNEYFRQFSLVKSFRICDVCSLSSSLARSSFPSNVRKCVLR